MPKPTYQLSQVILYVKDMAAEVHFYRNLLGLTVVYPENTMDYRGEVWVELDAGGFNLALHGGVDDPPGDDHELVFTVDDLMAAWLELGEAGDYIGKVRTLETGEPFATGHDPEGHRFSIRELIKE